jgi:hypothetical protein
MNKIKEIVLSYAAAFNPTEEQSNLAEERLLICVDCEHWVQGSIRDYCGKCGCTTSKKVFSPNGAAACPEGKWQR